MGTLLQVSGRVLDLLFRVSIGLAVASVLCLTTVELWQVVARYVLNDAPSWTEPVALLCMSTAMMFGAAAGVRTNRHFSFTLLVDAMPAPLRRALRVLAGLVCGGIGLVLAVWGGVMAVDAWVYPMSGAPIPQGLIYLPLCAGGALIALFSIENMLRPAPVATGE